MIDVEIAHIARQLTRIADALEEIAEAIHREQHVTIPASAICGILFLPEDINEGPRTCILAESHEGNHSWGSQQGEVKIDELLADARTRPTEPPKIKTCRCGANSWGVHPNPEHSDVVICENCGRGYIKDENGEPKL